MLRSNMQLRDDKITFVFCSVAPSWHVKLSGAEYQQYVSIFPKTSSDMSCDELSQCVLLPEWLGHVKVNKHPLLKLQLKQRWLKSLIKPYYIRATDIRIIITLSFSNGDCWILQYALGTQINFSSFATHIHAMRCSVIFHYKPASSFSIVLRCVVEVKWCTK